MSAHDWYHSDHNEHVGLKILGLGTHSYDEIPIQIRKYVSYKGNSEKEKEYRTKIKDNLLKVFKDEKKIGLAVAALNGTTQVKEMERVASYFVDEKRNAILENFVDNMIKAYGGSDASMNKSKSSRK